MTPTDHHATWGQRWVRDFERLSTAWQNRLPRGREYASKGHVIALSVTSGKISGKVQGSRSKPYSTTIELQANRGADWDRLIEELAKKALYPASLLTGHIPPSFEQLTEHFGIGLFLKRNSELIVHCTCPDKGRPCKHIAAVHYAFGEALDRDPFLLLQLRGADRDTLLRGFYREWFGDRTYQGETELSAAAEAAEVGYPISRQSADRFNRADQLLEDLSYDIRAPEAPLFILQRLGSPAPWKLPIGSTDLLGPVVEEASALALRIARSMDALREEGDEEDDDEELIDDDDDASDEELGGDGDDDDWDEEDDDDDDANDDPKQDAKPDAFVTLASPAEPEPRTTTSRTPSLSLPTHFATHVLPDPEASRSAADDRSPRMLLTTGMTTATPGASPTPGDRSPSAEPPRATTPVLIRRAPAERVASARKGKKKGRTQDPRTSLVQAVDARLSPHNSAPTSWNPDLLPHTPALRRRPTVVLDRSKDPAAHADQLDFAGRRALEAEDFAEALPKLRDAWRLHPSEGRLLLVLAAADGVGARAEVVRDEHAWIQTLSGPERQALDALDGLVALLAGDYGYVVERSEKHLLTLSQREEGWARVLISFTLFMLTHDAELREQSAIADLWEELFQTLPPELQALRDPPAPLGAWLEWSLEDHPISADQRSAFLRLTSRLVADLQRAKQSVASHDAALAAVMVTAGLAEALQLSEDPSTCEAFLLESASNFVRHPRIRLALDEGLERWPILSPIASSG